MTCNPGRISRGLAAVLVTITATACSSEAPPRQSADILAEVLAEAGDRNVTAAAPVVAGVSLPATFTGLLPCGDCEAIRLQINLLRDRSFVLRETRLGEQPRISDDHGAWVLGDDRRTLTLTSENRTTRTFSIRDERSLRPLDDFGREYTAETMPVLIRMATFESLERAIARPAATVVPLSLDGTPWTLTHLAGDSLAVLEAPKTTPFLEVRPATGQFSGSDGCNRLVGTYSQSGPTIAFSVGAVTRISCPDGGEVSRAFSSALAATRAWRIHDRQLELVGESGAVVARLAPRS